MRILTFLIATFFVLGSGGISAQNCSAWKKTHCNTYAKKLCNNPAAVAASLDNQILTVTDEAGIRKYVQKIECSVTGSVTYQDVIYSSKKGTFVCQPMKQCDISKCRTMSNCKVQCLKGQSATAMISQQGKRSRT